MSAIRVTTEQWSFDTDAEFQSWINAMAAALDGIGLVKTSDTGQITLPATITRAQTGFEIRRMNDAPQTTYPIFFKIAYSTVATVRPQITVDIGTGSNGSGTLTGAFVTGLTASTGTSGSGTTLADFFLSYGEGHFHWFGPVAVGQTSGYPNNPFWFSFERAMDELGVLHPEDGALIMSTPSNGMGKRIYAHSYGITATAPNGSQMCFPRSFLDGADDMFNDQIGVFPVPYMVRGRVRWCRHTMNRASRLAYGSVIPCEHLGEERTFIALGSSWPCSTWSQESTTNADHGILLPWYV